MSGNENDDTTEAPDQPPSGQQDQAALLTHLRAVTMERFVSHLNGVGASIINAYPMAEVQSWTIQRAEAEAIHALGESAVLALSAGQAEAKAPFLAAVCRAQYGNTGDDDAVLATQLWTKALQVQTNAALWANLSAFVNGLRARTASHLEAAASVIELYTIESEAQTELGSFRAQYGV